MNTFEDSSEDLGTVSRSSSSGWNCSNDSHRHSCLSFASNGTLPKPEVVSELGPEEIRWFFKENGSKKWVPFIGYDSLRIEFKFREFQSLSTNKSSFDSKLTVRGGLYEIELHMMKCMPIYWNGEECKITRGIWFVVGSWQPINEEYSNIIEEEHLKMFKGEILSESESNSGENVLHSISLMNFVVEWISLSNVQMFRCSSSTKLLRTVSRAFGINKAGTKLQRGYYVDSSPNDKPLDISHVVFVIHGIGQKMDIGAITKNCRM